MDGEITLQSLANSLKHIEETLKQMTEQWEIDKKEREEQRANDKRESEEDKSNEKKDCEDEKTHWWQYLDEGNYIKFLSQFIWTNKCAIHVKSE